MSDTTMSDAERGEWQLQPDLFSDAFEVWNLGQKMAMFPSREAAQEYADWKLANEQPTTPEDVDAALLRIGRDSAMEDGRSVESIIRSHIEALAAENARWKQKCSICGTISKKLTAAEQRVAVLEAVREAAGRLAQQMARVYKAMPYIRAWQVAQSHLGPYDGPTWTDEQEALEAALAAAEES